MEVPPDDPEKDERCRTIERGARLVTAVPTNMSLILQMPRGNLETIFPRAMVLAGIRELIDGQHYNRAFRYCRTQRVDMNILYDHRPAQFLANVGSFLDQLVDITSIDLFLSSLRYIYLSGLSSAQRSSFNAAQGRRCDEDYVSGYYAYQVGCWPECDGFRKSTNDWEGAVKGQYDL